MIQFETVAGPLEHESSVVLLAVLLPRRLYAWLFLEFVSEALDVLQQSARLRLRHDKGRGSSIAVVKTVSLGSMLIAGGAASGSSAEYRPRGDAGAGMLWGLSCSPILIAGTAGSNGADLDPSL